MISNTQRIHKITSFGFLAAVTCWHFPVSAQSNVQAFGVMDVGISYYKVNQGEKLLALSDSGNTTSRIGFRGSEDLGQGIKAIFWLEGGVSPSTGNTVLSFTRRSVVGISGDFGQITLGREYTPGYSIHSSFGGPFGTNGVADNLLYRARVVMHDSNNAGQPAYVRSSNAITYISPVTHGLYGQFMYGLDEQVRGNSGRYLGGRLGYLTEDFDISTAYNTVAGGENSPSAAPRKIKNLGIGASYKFSTSKISLLYVDDAVQMPSGDKKLQGLSFGLESKVGSGAIRAALGQVKFKYQGQHSKATKYSLGYVHNLSKRTALYTSLAYIDNGFGTSFVVNPGVAGIENKGSSGIDFGIRHIF